MPYIAKPSREDIDTYLDELLLFCEENVAKHSDRAGIVDYIVTRIILSCYPETRFKDIAELNGVLTLVLDEFNRRKTHPYEDQKIKDNGDVYGA